MTMANGNNSFGDWLSGRDWGSLLLEQLPQATYYSSPAGRAFTRTPQGAYSPRKGRYYQQAYQDVFSDYMGAIGSALRGGQEPATFQDFLETASPWTARYGRLPQTARGVTGMAANPRTRFLFNY